MQRGKRTEAELEEMCYPIGPNYECQPLREHCAKNASMSDVFLVRTAQPCDFRVHAFHAAHITITPPSSPVPGCLCYGQQFVFCQILMWCPLTISSGRHLAGIVFKLLAKHVSCTNGSIMTARASRRGLHPPLPSLCAGSCCVVHRTLPGRGNVVAVGWRK